MEIFSQHVQNDKNQRFKGPEKKDPIGTTCTTRKNRFNKANKKSDFRKFLQNNINEAKTLIKIQESQIGTYVKTKKKICCLTMILIDNHVKVLIKYTTDSI